MPGQDADHIPALTGAEADQADVPGGGTFELGAQVPLHEFQPPREQRARIVVVPVPFHPVALRHPTTLQFARRAATTAACRAWRCVAQSPGSEWRRTCS